MTMFKKLSLIATSLLLTVSLTACSSSPSLGKEEFDEFIDTQFKDKMQSDYVTMHILLQDPEEYGIDPSSVKVSLGARVDEKEQEQLEKKSRESWETFQSIDRSKLTDEQKELYDIYNYQESLNQKLSDEKFDYYQPLFSSLKGIHHQLPTLFSDWTLRNEQDVKDLIVLVNDVLPYVESIIDYTEKQAELGLLMVDQQEVIDYCSGIVKAGKDSAILKSMFHSIDVLDLDQAQAYKDDLTKAFQSSFLPAYQMMIDCMQDLKDEKNNTEGLAAFPHGKEYYTLLLQQNIGSMKSVEDVKKMMEDCFDDHVNQLTYLLMTDESLLDEFSKAEEKTTPFTSYDEILTHIQKEFTNDFPAPSSLDFHITNIDEEIASDNGNAAYFNIPALDDTGVKQLRVNPLTGNISSISTYQTVAHEGFPGHMYQFDYAYTNIDSNYRLAFADSLAYTEGYAVYTQYYANKYIPNIEQSYLACLKENELASYNVILLSDIGIHYDGWSFDKFKSFLSDHGFILDDESYRSQYKQLQQNPAVFAPYYVGYEEIAAMKQKAQKELGNAYNDLDFHTALLESGAAPFSVVEQHIDAYIKEHK